jgi:hypothetical protein
VNEIVKIVESVLEANDGKSLDNDEERNIVANAIASKLIAASLEQLATVLNGSIEHDNDGQTIICTGIFNEGVSYDKLTESHKEWN